MKTTLTLITALATASQAAVTSLTPADINGGDTNRSTFTDGNITLNPLEAGVASTFNDNSVRLGIDDTPTPAGTIANNVNAFNDVDVDPNNGNEQQLEFIFAPTVGLSQIAYDFSRADGPGDDDGVIISGFTADPGVTFSVSNPNLFAVYNSVAGAVRLNIPGGLFSGTDVFVDFDPDASRGQTLLLKVTDTTQHGAQLAITGISYDVVPEPSIALLGGLGLLGLLRRRR